MDSAMWTDIVGQEACVSSSRVGTAELFLSPVTVGERLWAVLLRIHVALFFDLEQIYRPQKNWFVRGEQPGAEN